MWTEIARAKTTEELQNLVPTYADIPAGTEVNIHLELQWWVPIGKLADLAGAEWWAPRLAQADMDVIDVSGNWHYIDIRGIARGMPVVLLIAILASAVAILGIGAYISSVVITANMETKKLEQANEWLRAGYTPEQVSQMLGAATFTPSLPSIPTPTLAGLGIGTIAIIAVIAFLLLRR